MTADALAPGVEALVAHLRGRTVEDLLAGTIEAPGSEPAPVPGVVATDLALDAPSPVPVRRYLPDDRRGSGPGVVWVHGGAWMYGSLDDPEADAVARRMCLRLGATVLSVDYRLAPAHTFPAPIEDVVVALDALAADPAVDPSRIVLGGASAGGNIAAGAALALRDRGGVQPAALLLAYPATDPKGGPYPDERPEVCPQLLWFDPDTTGFLFDVYLGGAAPMPQAVPASGDLGGLPPTLVTTSSLDALADQAVRFAELAAAAGVTVEHHAVDGVLHGYLSMCGVVEAADAALERHLTWIEDHLA